MCLIVTDVLAATLCLKLEFGFYVVSLVISETANSHQINFVMAPKEME